MVRKLRTYQTSLGFFDQPMRPSGPHCKSVRKPRTARWEKQKHKLDLVVRRARKQLTAKGSDLKVPLPARP